MVGGRYCDLRELDHVLGESRVQSVEDVEDTVNGTGQRRSAECRFEVALEAAESEKTLSQLAQQYQRHPGQISQRKRQLRDEGTRVLLGDLGLLRWNSRLLCPFRGPAHGGHLILVYDNPADSAVKHNGLPEAPTQTLHTPMRWSLPLR